MQTEEWKASLKKLQLERYAYNHASACIYFDSATVAPRGSAEARSMALGILSEKSYHLFVNNETRNLLDELRSRRTELDELTLRQVELLSEELDDLTRIPVQEYVAYNQLTNEASSAWVDAKEQNEYALFRPYLSKV
ncbi:MAG: carboxypeptidase M32, partial [Clostridia bacterium]